MKWFLSWTLFYFRDIILETLFYFGDIFLFQIVLKILSKRLVKKLEKKIFLDSIVCFLPIAIAWFDAYNSEKDHYKKRQSNKIFIGSKLSTWELRIVTCIYDSLQFSYFQISFQNQMRSSSCFHAVRLLEWLFYKGFEIDFEGVFFLPWEPQVILAAKLQINWVELRNDFVSKTAGYKNGDKQRGLRSSQALLALQEFVWLKTNQALI